MSEAAARRAARQHNELVWHAWNSAALHRQRRLPPLAKLMIPDRQPRQQTWQEQMQIFRAITVVHGGEVI